MLPNNTSTNVHDVRCNFHVVFPELKGSPTAQTADGPIDIMIDAWGQVRSADELKRGSPDPNWGESQR
jgi:hypothetical protein